MALARKNKSPDKRKKLIQVGVVAFTERGFYNTSIDELVSAADVPKGSFAYYFGHKDKYTLAVIRCYADYFNKKLDKILLDDQLSPIDRIERFIHEATRGMERYEFKRGCLVGNLGQELAALDDNCRAVLLETLRAWQDRILACLKEAQAQHLLADDVDVQGLAQFFWYAWEGAVLGAKLERSRAPLDLVGDAFMARLHDLARNQAPADIT